jgi:TusA-related sulfurtransferase
MATLELTGHISPALCGYPIIATREEISGASSGGEDVVTILTNMSAVVFDLDAS